MQESFVAKAHGRVNLIGEHTDYNGGWVLPTPIHQFTEVKIIKRSGIEIQVESQSTSIHKKRSYSYQLGEEFHQGNWTDYIQGATKILSRFIQPLNQSISGFIATINSNVPEGSGLSSSAALEMSFLKAIRKAYQLNISDIDLAKIGQRIENEFVGARVGIMDQMATAFAHDGEALFLDTQNLTYERIKLPLDQMDLLVINSGISHKLSSKEGYNQRRQECELACSLLKVDSLRNLTLSDLDDDLPLKIKKRVKHVITENERVFEAVAALKRADLVKLGQLFIESHYSMRDDYEVSLKEIDTLVELSLEHKDVFGARLTGGGFGGSIVAITKKGKGKDIAQDVIEQYYLKTKQRAELMSAYE
ncbi:MAG: galactokinase [Bacteriovoracaceae bacterium]